MREFSANQEFEISFWSSDGVIKEAMNMLFVGKSWHFLKKSSDVRLKEIMNESKGIKKISNKSSKLSLMECIILISCVSYLIFLF